VEAHALLADALVAVGRSEDALDEYNEALQHVPHQLKPPRWLFLRAAQLRAKMVANLPTQESGPPTADEAAYEALVAAGDKSAAALKYPDALRNYLRAQNLVRAKKIAVDPGELQERIAYVREQQKHPATRPK
jgi:tetratricopeptide (TPR) repeat protein